MSTLLQINHLTKTYGPRVIFDDATLSIGEKQKIGVIGRNGAGKSTLFKMIVGEEEITSGEVNIHDTCRLAYMTQHDPFELTETVMVFLLRDSGKEMWQCAKVAGAFQLKHELLEAEIGALSGGYQMRVKLVALLLHEPNLLLLDEPTNYLDLSTLLLLEKFLQSYWGSFLIISHDREFLKNTCEQTLEVDQGTLTLFPQPLEEYFAYKEEQLEMAKRFNKKVEQEKKHLQSFVDRFRYKASKASQAQSKLKQMERLKTIDIVHPMSSSRIRIPRVEGRSGTALRVQNMTIGYANKTVASDIELDIDRGEHIAIVGDNGQGKTTFLKTIAGELAPLDGSFRWGPHMSIGYYAQHVSAMLKPTDQVGKYLASVAAPDLKQEEILEMAGNFLFRDDDLKKSVSLLSGGERARLCLAGLLLQKHSVLLLDEPTNHFDFETVEALGVALKASNNTILFISHDRTFVNLVATGIIEVKNGTVRRFHRNYEEYVYFVEEELRKKSEEMSTPPSPTHVEGRGLNAVEEEKENKLFEKQKQKKLQEIELKIEELTREKKRIHNWFLKHPGQYSIERSTRLEEIEQLMKQVEEEWMIMSEK